MVMRKPRINLIFDFNFIPVFVLPSLCFDALWWKCFHKLVLIRERECGRGICLYKLFCIFPSYELQKLVLTEICFDY